MIHYSNRFPARFLLHLVPQSFFTPVAQTARVLMHLAATEYWQQLAALILLRPIRFQGLAYIRQRDMVLTSRRRLQFQLALLL
jgi:hypothetical protein